MENTIEKVTDEMMMSMNEFVLNLGKFREEVLNPAVKIAIESDNFDNKILYHKYCELVNSLSYELEDLMHKAVDISDTVTNGTYSDHFNEIFGVEEP